MWRSVRSLSRVGRSFHAGVTARDAAGVPLVVQKYGGTSLGTPEKLEKVLNIVNTWHEKGRVIAVVSALSSETKSEGTTSLLLSAAESAVNRQEYNAQLNKIEDTHLDVIYTMLKSHQVRESVRRWVQSELSTVRQFCASLTVIRELSPRSHDLIIGCGERLAAGVVSGVLRENGIPSVPVNLSNLFEDSDLDTTVPKYHHKAQVSLRRVVQAALEEEERVVPVVTGYLGPISGGIIKGVGRGYSDLTAALVSAAMEADAMQVWKESDGIFTGNPTKIPQAKLVHHVTPREAAELTYFGNEVLHPFTMECAIEAKIPIHILNTFKPESPGTVVDPSASTGPTSFRPTGMVAVACKKPVRTLNLSSNRIFGSTRFLARVFELFSKHSVKVDLISTTETNISTTIHESVPEANLQELRQDLNDYGKCTVEHDRAIVSAIGEGMAHQVGLAASMFSCLAEGNINLQMIAQGSSEINMSVVINVNEADDAIKLIHKQFIEDHEEQDDQS